MFFLTHIGGKKGKMQLDVGMEPTFRFEHMICICKEIGIVKFEILWNFTSLIFVTDRQTDGRTDRQTESDAYEPTVQFAQVGSKNAWKLLFYEENLIPSESTFSTYTKGSGSVTSWNQPTAQHCTLRPHISPHQRTSSTKQYTECGLNILDRHKGKKRTSLEMSINTQHQ